METAFRQQLSQVVNQVLSYFCIIYTDQTIVNVEILSYHCRNIWLIVFAILFVLTNTNAAQLSNGFVPKK